MMQFFRMSGYRTAQLLPAQVAVSTLDTNNELFECYRQLVLALLALVTQARNLSLYLKASATSCLSMITEM